MGLFDIFGKKKKEEQKAPEKETNSIEYNVYEIGDSFSLARQRRYEEMNQKREREIEENLKKLKEAAQQEIEIKEKERQLARKQAELEKAKREYAKETSEQFEKFEKETQQIKNKMQAEIDKTTKEQEAFATDMSNRIRGIDNLPGSIRARNVAAEGARELLNMAATNKKEKEFEKYDKISGLLLSSEWGLNIWRNDNKDDVLKYRELPEKDRRSFFVPFLIEKEEFGLASNSDMRTLEQMRKDTNMTISEQYTRGLVLLQEFQLIDITDTSTFSRTFDSYSEMKREEIKEKADLEVMMEDSPKTDGSEGKKNYL